MYNNKLILAPMVRMGRLPFRLLCIQYGVDLVYSEEIIDHKLIKCQRIVNPVLNTIDFIDPSGHVVFRTCALEKCKIILQLGTASGERALMAAKLVENDVAGIDINMGCPKDYSVLGGMGAALLSKPDTIVEILTTLVSNVKVPITCKIRILPTLDKTLELLQIIQSTGVKAIAIHGRLREQRSVEPNQNEMLSAICKSGLLMVPIIANGVSEDIKCFEDIEKCRKSIGCDSIMLARAAQKNPSIFCKNGALPSFQMAQDYFRYSLEVCNTFGNNNYSLNHLLTDKDIIVKLFGCDSIEQQADLLHMSSYYHKINTMHMETYCRLEPKIMLLLKCNGLTYEPQKQDDNSEIVPDVSEEGYLELHFQYRKRSRDPSTTPKEIAMKWTKKQSLQAPVYVTTERSVDRKFKSIVKIGEHCYSSSYWERNKKFAEQSAASVAMQLLKMDTNCLNLNKI